MKLLRLLSKDSHQNITYHCRNSVAYRDEAGGGLKKALILRGANGQDLRAQGSARLRYSVLEDGCSVRACRRTGIDGEIADIFNFAYMQAEGERSGWAAFVI